jgi:radical SAM protein with 4Fe4S-binding SPASM domain
MDLRKADTLGSILIKAGIREIDVLGGEPMLVDWMRDFVEEMTGSGISVNISTNGSLPEAVSRLSEVQTGLMNIGFSLHGLPETHTALTLADHFSAAISGIKSMIERGKSPIVKSALTAQNMPEIHELVHYLVGLGVRRYFLLHEDIIGREAVMPCISFSEFRKFHGQLKENFIGDLDIGFVAASCFYKYGIKSRVRCDAGSEKLAVMPDGSVFPCNLFAGFEEFRLGNIFRDSMDEILENPALDYFRQQSNGCEIHECEHYSTCTGGCPAHSYYFYGTLDAGDPRCTNVRPNGHKGGLL